MVVPNLKFDKIKMSDTLTIEIVHPKKLAPIVTPEPHKAIEPIRQQPALIKPLPKISHKLDPKPIETKPSPTPTDAAPPPTVISAAHKVDTPPVTITQPIVHAPEPPKKIEPNEDDVNAALSQYGSALGRAIAKHKQYPKIAQMRGWQGECLLDLKIDSSGNVLSSVIKQTSGFDALDKQALEMVLKASPLPTPPEALRGRNFNITVPVTFKLE